MYGLKTWMFSCFIYSLISIFVCGEMAGSWKVNKPEDHVAKQSELMGQSSTQTSSPLLAAIHSEVLQAYPLSLALSPKQPLFSLFPSSFTPHRLELMRVLTRQCTHSLFFWSIRQQRGKGQIGPLSLLFSRTLFSGRPPFLNQEG